MQITPTAIPDVLVLEPKVFADARGYFFESYNQKTYAAMGLTEPFVQDNQSRSKRGVLRGLHFQVENAQGKLVRVLYGKIYDVAVDIRKGSPTFGKWVAEELSSDNHRMLWIPKGLAHGFYTLTDTADVAYKVTDFYAPQHERTLLWNDPQLAIDWKLQGEPILSDKDRAGLTLKQIVG